MRLVKTVQQRRKKTAAAFAAFALALGLANAAPAAPVSAAGGAPEAVAPTAARIHFANGAASSGWLPFEFFGETRIFVTARVNGRPTQVMLDSGASSTVLDRRFAASLGLVAKGDLVGEGGGGSASYSELHGVTLTLGDLSLTTDAAVALDLAPVETQVGHPLPVVLGGEVFRDLVVDIDFKGRRIAFRDPARFRAPQGAQLAAMTPSGENQAIVAIVDGRPAKLLFDLGNASALALFPRFWDKPAFIANRSVSATMAGGWGGMGVDGLTMVHSVTLGGARFRNLPARLEGLRSADARGGELDGNLGMPVLSRFHLVIDFGRHRVYFAPPIDTARAFAVNHAGLTLQPGAQGAKILFVAAHSPAEAAGLSVGDVIVAVDGSEGGGQGARQSAWLFEPVGKTLRIHLADGRVRTLKTARYF